jgi:acyl dehydratase
MGVNYGYNKVRFMAPVKSGKRIRGRFVVKGLEPQSGGRMQILQDVTVEIEGEPKAGADRRMGDAWSGCE